MFLINTSCKIGDSRSLEVVITNIFIDLHLKMTIVHTSVLSRLVNDFVGQSFDKHAIKKGGQIAGAKV